MSKFQAPKGFTQQSSNAVGSWDDDGDSDVLFTPTGVRLFDGGKRADPKKPSIMILGILNKPGVKLQNKDETIEGQQNDLIGVFWKPGMGREIVNALGVQTWIAPLFDEKSGERKTLDTGKGNPMKVYDVRFGKKLADVGKRIPILDDTRVLSKGVKTPFDDPRLAAVRPKSEASDETPDDNDIPF